MGKPMIDRRTFLKGAGAVAASGIVSGALGGCASNDMDVDEDTEFPAPKSGKPAEARFDPDTGRMDVNQDVVIRYSMCLGCYNVCGNRNKIDRATGRILSVGGNPYHPCSSYPYLHTEDPLEEAYKSFAFANRSDRAPHPTICGRGQGTLDSYERADRITTPLKRAGKRGEGKWESISWEQLITEVVEGGRLFEDIGDDREVEGLKDIHDTTTPMDAEKPWLGPKANQLVTFGGRTDGRDVVFSRFTNAFGTKNHISHHSSCAGAQGQRALTENGGALLCQPDLENAEYIIWMGTFPGANGRNFQSICKRASALLRKGAKMDVIDPVLSGGLVTPSAPNIKWHPIKTSTDVDLALAMIRWMIENNRVNRDFISIPNYRSAYAAGYGSYTNATHLVVDDETSPDNRKMMSWADAGLNAPQNTPAIDQDVVIDAETGTPALSGSSSKGTLEFDGEVNGVHVRTAYLFLKDNAMEFTVDELSEKCGVPVDEIERMADEFTSHGTKAVARGLGSTASANGADMTLSFRTLNALIGSNQMKGGCMPFRAQFVSTGNGSRYLLGKVDNPKKGGLSIDRTGTYWPDTGEYAARVAAGEADPQPTLPWYGGAADSDAQGVVSIVNGYPYSPKAVLTWMGNPVQATPGGMRDTVLDAFKDVSRVPLHIVCDCFFGEMASLADYIVPDTTPYESFGALCAEGHWYGKGTGVCWPVKEPETMVLPDGRHASFEAFLVDVAKRLGLPGFGEGAIEDVDGGKHDFDDACDFFVKAFANVAFGDSAQGPVMDITDDEARMQALDEVPDAWKAAVTEEEWPKVLKVMSRGGRFRPIEEAYKNGRSAYATTYQSLIYSQPIAVKKNEYSGSYSSGALKSTPQLFANGRPMTDYYSEQEFPFRQCSQKGRFRSATMLANSKAMVDLCKENHVEMNDEDAKALGIADGDRVRITSTDGSSEVGVALVRAGVARGTYGVAFGYGHKAYGASDVVVDGKRAQGDPSCGRGFNAMSQADPTVNAFYLVSDSHSSVPARNGGMYKIEKA